MRQKCPTGSESIFCENNRGSEAMSESENLSQGLRKWAVDEMRFHTSSYNNGKPIPNEIDFEKLCRRPFSDILEFLVKHIKASQHVRHVKDNLLLQRKEKRIIDESNEENKRRLRRRKHELEAEKLRLKDDLAMLERETEQVAQLLVDTNQDYENELEQVRNLQRKKCLLAAAYQRSSEKVAEFGEYTNRLNGLVNSIIVKRKESERNNYLPLGDEDSSSEMETESCCDVRLVCEDISMHLHSSLGNREEGEDKKEQVLKRVSDLHVSYSTHTLIDSLTRHTQACCRQLREDTVIINIPSEVQDLSFSMDKKGHVHDESEPHSMQMGLKKLLQASHLNHVMRWSEEQKYLCESWKLEAQLDNVRGEIHKMVVKTLGGNPRLVQQAEEYVDHLLNLASEKSVAPCLKREMQMLITEISKAKAVHAELRNKYSQIQEFKKIVENKQTILGTLARYNSGAPTRLEKLKEQCKSYLATRPIQSHMAVINSIASDLLPGCFEKEITKFQPLPLICFLSLSLNSGARSSILDVSISPSSIPGTRGITPAYSLLCEALNSPSYKSPDHLMSHVLQLQDCIQRSQLTQERIMADRAAMCMKAGVEDDPQCHRDLIQSSREHDVRLKETCLPRLARLMEMSNRWSRKVAEDMPSHLEAWWQQPAQYATPWKVVEGMTFDQWMQRFKLIISQVNQKHMEKQHS